MPADRLAAGAALVAAGRSPRAAARAAGVGATTLRRFLAGAGEGAAAARPAPAAPKFAGAPPPPGARSDCGAGRPGAPLAAVCTS